MFVLGHNGEMGLCGAVMTAGSFMVVIPLNTELVLVVLTRENNTRCHVKSFPNQILRFLFYTTSKNELSNSAKIWIWSNAYI